MAFAVEVTLRCHLSGTAGHLLRMVLVCPVLALPWGHWQKYPGGSRETEPGLHGPLVREDEAGGDPGLLGVHWERPPLSTVPVYFCNKGKSQLHHKLDPNENRTIHANQGKKID